MAKDDIGQVQRLQGTSLFDVSMGTLGESGDTAGEIDDVGPYRRRRYVVELGGRLVPKPADVFFPDCPHDPWHLAVHLG